MSDKENINPNAEAKSRLGNPGAVTRGNVFKTDPLTSQKAKQLGYNDTARASAASLDSVGYHGNIASKINTLAGVADPVLGPYAISLKARFLNLTKYERMATILLFYEPPANVGTLEEFKGVNIGGVAVAAMTAPQATEMCRFLRATYSQNLEGAVDELSATLQELSTKQAWEAAFSPLASALGRASYMNNMSMSRPGNVTL